MITERVQIPVLALLHASLFSAGLLCLLVGLAIDLPYLLVVAGPCLAASGLLIWVGSRITLMGPLGDALRLALGRTRVVTLHVRAVVWLLVGILVTLWGVRAMHDAQREPPLYRQPLAEPDPR
jgi:hypothetical protein